MAWLDEGSVGQSFASRAALLTAAASATPQSIATVQTEQNNLYMRDFATAKWVICSGNRYTTAAWPSETDFIIPIYTKITNITTGIEYIQQT